MSISIYYKACRTQSLTEIERQAIATVIRKYSVNDQIEEYMRTREGPNWESFTVYDTVDSPMAILEGATKLPDNTQDAIWLGLQHWCKALSELRRSIRDATWRVHVDDHDIEWDELRQEYDPTN